MRNIIMDSFVLILFFLLIWKVNIAKPLEKGNENYLSPKSTKMLKGFFSIVVIFHHLAQRTSGGIVFHKFTQVGYLATAVFFFISGYGLQKKYMIDENYDKCFLVKRLPVVLIPYLVMNFIYWLVHVFFGEVYSLKQVLLTIWRGDPMVYFSWYVITILIFYIVFYILMKICKRNHYKMIIGTIIYYVLWVLLCRKLGYGKWWYNSSHLLVLGVTYAILENRILPILKSCYRALIPILLCFLYLCYKFPKEMAQFLPIRGISFLIPLMCAILFVVVLVLFSMKIQIGNRILNYLGEISFEIYLSQGIWILFLRNDFVYISNPIVYSLTLIFGTIMIAHILHKLFGFLLKKYKTFISLRLS